MEHASRKEHFLEITEAADDLRIVFLQLLMLVSGSHRKKKWVRFGIGAQFVLTARLWKVAEVFVCSPTSCL